MGRRPPRTPGRPALPDPRPHGIVSLELASHFTGMGFDPAELYESELQYLAR